MMSEVRARKFVLEDEMGRIRAWLLMVGPSRGWRYTTRRVSLAPTARDIPRPLSLHDNDLHDLLDDRKSRWPLGDRVAFELD